MTAPKKRPYALRQRKEKLEETRQRIAEAVAALHEEVGPRHTTISAIAERAGVERLTVYRHFPDEDALFAACSGHWSARNPPPDPAVWREVAGPADRTRHSLEALYAYFGRNRRMLANIQRDVDDIPALKKVAQPFAVYLRQVADELAAGWPVQGRIRKSVTTVLNHAVQFTTWQTLEAAGATEDGAKAALVATWVQALAAGK